MDNLEQAIRELTAIMKTCARLNCELMAMASENNKRFSGEDLAYGDEQFRALIDAHGLEAEFCEWTVTKSGWNCQRDCSGMDLLEWIDDPPPEKCTKCGKPVRLKKQEAKK